MPRYAYTIRFMTPAGEAGQGGLVFEGPPPAANTVIINWGSLVTFEFFMKVNGVNYPFDFVNTVKFGGIRIAPPSNLVGIFTPGQPGLPSASARLVVVNGPTLTLRYANYPNPPPSQPPEPLSSSWSLTGIANANGPIGGTLQVTGPTQLN